jgi:hypothetical protein
MAPERIALETLADRREGNADASARISPRLKSIEGLLKYAGISKYFALPVLVPAYSVLFAKVRCPLCRTACAKSDAYFSSCPTPKTHR